MVNSVIWGGKLRSSRTIKNKNKKNYIRYLLLTFLVIIPITAIISSVGVFLSVDKDKHINMPIPAFTPIDKSVNAFKYNFDIESKQLYRVELNKFDQYEAAEAQIASLKKKKLNGFIVKENGYLTAYGMFCNKSQADTAVEFLKRRKVSAVAVELKVSGISLQYSDIDKNLIDIAEAVDAVLVKIISEKSALSLESLYSDKQMGDQSLQTIIEQEAKLYKYMNYLKEIKTSEVNAEYKSNLEALISEVLVDKLEANESYDYYSLQNSLMNQGGALMRFYEKLSI